MKSLKFILCEPKLPLMINTDERLLTENPPTLADLGKILNLSKRAVAQALNDRGGTVKVSAATRARVQSLAKKMGYRQNMAATALSIGRTGLFGILSPVGRMHLTATRLASAVDAFQSLNISPIVICSGSRTEDAQETYLSALIGARLDGVLLLNRQPQFTDRHVEELRRFGMAVVQVGSTNVSSNMCHFLTSRRQAFDLVLAHLIEQGFRKIAALVSGGAQVSVSPAFSSSGPQTRVGLLEAANKIRNQGINFNLEIHEAPQSSDGAEVVHPLYRPGYLGMKNIIQEKKVPEALICQVDGWAWGAMRACAEAGIRIPQDMGITGYSNEPVCSAASHPLTSVEEPFDEMCQLGVEELVSAARKKIPPQPHATILPCRLIVRESSLRRSDDIAAFTNQI